jgi:hypothetical protein
MEWWSNGVVEDWSGGGLEWWRIGVVEDWKVGVMDGNKKQGYQQIMGRPLPSSVQPLHGLSRLSA